MISQLLDQHNMKHIIIESYPKMVEIAKRDWKNVILWDASNKHILHSLKIKKAKSVIISVWNNEKLYHICHTVSEEVKKWKIIVKANKYEEKEMLEKLNLGHIIVETEATALGMFNEIPKYK